MTDQRQTHRRADDNVALAQLRKEIATLRDKWTGIVLLLLCATFVLGIYAGQQMVLRSQQNVKTYQQEGDETDY